MTMDILNIGANAVDAFQLGASVTAQNIANSGDQDYSRERVDYSTIANGGLNVSIKRISDDFLNSYLNTTQSEVSRSSISSSIYSGVDQYITGLNATGKDGPYNILSHSVQGLFDSFSALSTSPTDAGRESIISHANMLTRTIHSISDYIDQKQISTDSKITGDINEVNDLTKQIATVNSQITQSTHEQSLGLLDQRDKLLNQLSHFVAIKTKITAGEVTVTMKNGQELVSGSLHHKMSASLDEYGTKMTVSVSGVNFSSHDDFSGEIGGLIKTRNVDLLKTQEKIGRLSATVTQLLNKQNKAGFLKSGAAGTNLFSEMTFEGHASSNNAGNENITVSLDETKISDLKDGGYKITRTADGKYQVDDKEQGTTAIYTTLPIEMHGLKINVTAPLQAGDSFVINPMAEAASQMKLTGNANSIALSNKSDGSGTDNVNAFANLSSEKIFNGGKETLVQGVAAIFSYIGGVANSAKTETDSASASLKQATLDKQSVSGVNTQEEYTNLVHFQQSYAAASRIISTDQKMFSALFSAAGV